jgi:hypothetical protein
VKICKSLDGEYMMLFIGGITIFFTHYEKNYSSVSLMDKERVAATLYFDEATQFYKAWRAMK